MSTSNFIYPVLRRLGWPGRILNRWLLRTGFWNDKGIWVDESTWND